MGSGVNTAALFAATLALIVAFAWTSVATKSMQQVLPVRHKNDIIKVTLIYALIITLFVIFVVCMLNETNKVYYTYTGNIFLNFSKYAGKSSYLLSFWAPKKDDVEKNKTNSNNNYNTNNDNNNNDNNNNDSNNNNSNNNNNNNDNINNDNNNNDNINNNSNSEMR